MRKLSRLGWGSRVLLALAVGGAVFGVAAVVQAAVPSSDGRIHACYGNASQPVGVRGDVRVRINWPAEPCPNGFTPFEWNVVGPTGPTGATGPTGPTGAAGAGARAYAYVDPSPLAFVAGHVLNFSAVTRPSTGIYCLTPSGGVSQTNAVPSVTVEWGESGPGSNLIAFWREHPNGNSCPSTNDFEVRTYDTGDTNVLANDVAFTIVVP
jgi:hypothetical protein